MGVTRQPCPGKGPVVRQEPAGASLGSALVSGSGPGPGQACPRLDLWGLGSLGLRSLPRVRQTQVRVLSQGLSG